MSKAGYGQILKSSVMTGGAQLVTMLSGFVRMKLAAMLIGVGGVGLVGLYNQSTALVAAICGLGLNNSGVREVAAAEGDPERLGRVVRSLRILVWGTGLLGALVCIVFSGALSRSTFGDDTHRVGFMVLGSALFLTEMAAGQSALLRGLGRIRELALQSVCVAVVSTTTAGICYWFWGVKGVVPALVLTAFSGLIGSWWFVRKVNVPKVRLTREDVFAEGGAMLRMGVAFVVSSLVNMGVAYAVAVMIRRELGIEGNGYYQAAWGLSGMVVGFVLSAMGQDFYPRLTGLIGDREEARRLINAQTAVGILLALPGVVGTVAVAHWLLPVLFSREFLPAADAVGWFALGCFGRIISWPLGYVLIAKGESFWFSATEAFFGTLQLGLAWCGLRLWGLTGVAVAFSVLYLCYGVAMRALTGRLIGFRYEKATLRLIAGGVVAIVAAILTGPWLGLPVAAVCAVVCLRGIVLRVGPDATLVRKLAKLPLAGAIIRKVAPPVV